jgi:hypothetical protein
MSVCCPLEDVRVLNIKHEIERSEPSHTIPRKDKLKKVSQ